LCACVCVSVCAEYSALEAEEEEDRSQAGGGGGGGGEDEYAFLDEINESVAPDRRLYDGHDFHEDGLAEQEGGYEDEGTPRSSSSLSVVSTTGGPAPGSVTSKLSSAVLGHWNIGEYLTPAAHIYLLHIIGTHITIKRGMKCFA
jgi:hypothetical protein